MKIREFLPFNSWVKVYNQKYWNNSTTPKFVEDQLSEGLYLNESKNVIRLKCLGLVAVTPLIHTINAVDEFSRRVFRLITLKAFRKGYSQSFSIKEFKKDFFSVIFFRDFLCVAALELSAIYGVVFPLDGRKLYASFERLQSPRENTDFSYEHMKALISLVASVKDQRALLAPCFQPDPKAHLLKGSLDKRNAF